jgi:adenylate kinase
MQYALYLALVLTHVFSELTYASDTEVSSKPYLIFLYGARGSGRAAIAVRLRQDFSFPDISLAPLISNHILDETSFGQKAREYLFKGVDLPTELSLAILYERLSQPDCLRGALFEDFPQSGEYYEAMKEHLSSYFHFLVISINASDDWLVERAEHRLVCRICGKVYVEPTSPAKHKGYCDICLEPLHRRLDDSPEVIKARVQNYRSQIAPLLAKYRKERILIDICGERKFEEVFHDVINAVEANTGIHAARTDQTVMK